MRFLGSHGTTYMAVATNSEHVKIFRRGTLDCQVLHGHSRVVLALDAFSPPPPLPLLLATSSKDHTIRVWEEGGDGGNGSEFICKGVGSGHTEAVGAVALSRYMYIHVCPLQLYSSMCMTLCANKTVCIYLRLRDQYLYTERYIRECKPARMSTLLQWNLVKVNA